MDGRTLTGGKPNTFLSGLVEFCVNLVSCFSRDADTPCVSVGLGSLSALCLLLSSCLLLCERCRCRRESQGEIVIFPYSLLGNLCSTVGAALSRQLYIQVLLSAFAAALDAAHFISWCFQVLLCWNSKAERRLRMMRGRRRQHLLAAFVLMVVAGGSLWPRLAHLPAYGPVSGRRLMQISQLDNTEILGYVLGLLSFVIASTARFPAIHRTYRGKKMTWTHVFSGLLSSQAGALYAAAVLLYDTHFEFLLRVMPWLLSAVGCAILDFGIIVIHCLKRQNRRQLTSLTPDTEGLLGHSHAESKSIMKTQRKQQAKNVQKLAEMGPYIDVSVQPAKKMCLQEVMLGTEWEDQFPCGKVRVSRAEGFCSSDTSFESSLSSDLEWDFEEENAQWRKPTTKQFLQQGDTINPKLCTYAMSALLLKPLSGKEEREDISSASLIK